MPPIPPADRSRFWPFLLAALAGTGPALAAPEAPRPTLEDPVVVRLQSPEGAVPAGGSSWLTLHLDVPEGLWIGAADRGVRSPGPTLLSPVEEGCFRFGRPEWPEPSVEGIPVKLGVTRVYAGRVTVPIPFTVAPGCPAGEHTAAVELTYTPGLDAGHLTPHIGERHEAVVEVDPAAASAAGRPAEPGVASSRGLRVERVETDLPVPLDWMVFGVPETSATARRLHQLWLDPEDHGKQVQAVVYPIGSIGANAGTSVGAGIGFVNTTREGIGTSAVNVTAVDNEHVGPLLSLDVVSCPAAYRNYWFSAFVSADETTRGASFRLENLTRDGGRWGYQIELDAFEDGRFRFFGLGAGSSEDDETAYGHRQLGGTGDILWNLATNWRLGGGVRVAAVEVGEAAEDLLDEEASIFDRFPAAPGLDGATVVAPRLTVIYDRRNQEFTPSRGTFVRLTLEAVENLDDDGGDLEGSWGAWRAEVRRYWSTPGQRYTLLARGEIDGTSGGELPFWELPDLGGAGDLRAYGEGRFRGESSFFASVELRVQAFHLVVAGMPMDLELAPFVDFGRVWDEDFFGSDFLEEDFNLDPGISMRVLNRPNIGLVVNYATGRDGGRFTGGVSLPF